MPGLVLPQRGGDDLLCSPQLVQGDQAGHTDAKQPHSPLVNSSSSEQRVKYR